MAKATQAAAETTGPDFKSNIKTALSFSIPLILTSCLMYWLGYYGHYNIYLGNYITAEDFGFSLFRDWRIILFYGICAGIVVLGLLLLKKLSAESVEEKVIGIRDGIIGFFDSSFFSGLAVVIWFANRLFPEFFARLIKTPFVAHAVLYVFLPLYALLFIYTLVQIVTIENDVKKIRKVTFGILISMIALPLAIGSLTANLSTPVKVSYVYQTGEAIPGPNTYLVGRTKGYIFLTNNDFTSRATLRSAAYEAGDVSSILFTDSMLTIVSRRNAPAKPLAASQGVDRLPAITVATTDDTVRRPLQRLVPLSKVLKRMDSVGR